MLKVSATLSGLDRKSTRLNSSHQSSYAVFCLKKKSLPGPDYLSRIKPSKAESRPGATNVRDRDTVTARIGEGHRNSVFFFNDTATTEIYTLSLHDALPI